MLISIDLHSHSPYAGASGKVNFPRLKFVMEKKGIDVYGCGDILLGKWEDELNLNFNYNKKKQLWEIGPNLYLFPQTEIIITCPYKNKKRKLFHLLIFFSNINEIKYIKQLALKKDAKLNIGRPFIKFSTRAEMTEFLYKIKENTNAILIPAHIMTPEGIFGGKNPVNSLNELFEEEVDFFSAFESGLSADPKMLAGLSEKYKIPIVSFSDSHSAAFNKLGREFTQIDLDNISSQEIINSIKKKKIIKTVEFPPFEGRYYLTGHRGNRQFHNGEEVVYIENAPKICPICKKKITLGVRDRLMEFSDTSSKYQSFIYQIPLVEIISKVLKVGVKTKTVEKAYIDILNIVGKESKVWLEDVEYNLKIDSRIIKAIKNIKGKKFKFIPGYDGKYGHIEF